MDQNINPIGIAYVAGPETRARLQASRDARRSRNAIRRLHHHALRTNDMLVEFVGEPECELQMSERAAISAHDEFARWAWATSHGTAPDAHP